MIDMLPMINRDTASAIKYLLDAVNKVVATLPANEQVII